MNRDNRDENLRVMIVDLTQAINQRLDSISEDISCLMICSKKQSVFSQRTDKLPSDKNLLNLYNRIKDVESKIEQSSKELSDLQADINENSQTFENKLSEIQDIAIENSHFIRDEAVTLDDLGSYVSNNEMEDLELQLNDLEENVSNLLARLDAIEFSD